VHHLNLCKIFISFDSSTQTLLILHTIHQSSAGYFSNTIKVKSHYF